MTVVRNTVCKVDNFDRAQTFTTTPTGEFGWRIADTSSSGTPTYLIGNNRAATLTLAATSEAENVCLYQGDVLPFLLNKIQRVKFVASVSGVDAVTTITFGIGTARNDTEDSVATNAWFRMEGSASTTAVVCETDDGVTDYDDKATGVSLSSTLKEFVIDFSNGLADVRFYIDGVRVATSTTFTLASATSSQSVQLLAQLAKASGTGTPALVIKKVEITYNTADGA